MSSARKLDIGAPGIEQAIEQKICAKELKLSADRSALDILFQRYAEEHEEISLLKLELRQLKIIH